jgi:hypothetical protein
MKTLRDRYHNDAEFKSLVDMMVNFIHECRYTPSEMRHAAIVASIIYEEHRLQVNPILLDYKTEKAFRHLESMLKMEEPPG